MIVYTDPPQRLAVDWGNDGAKFAIFVQGTAREKYGVMEYSRTVLVQPRCQHCKKKVTVAIKYTNGTVGIGVFLKARGIDWTKGNLIMKNPRYPIGIPCGCYARFQRQIVHLEGVVKRNLGQQAELRNRRQAEEVV